MGQLPGVHEAFGLRFTTGVDLWVPPLRPDGGDVDLVIDLTDHGHVDAAFSGPSDPPRVHEAMAGGDHYRVERGRAGDHRIELTGVARFHLTAGAGRLLCAPVDPDGGAWRRFLLDTVLCTVALLHGFEALHAGAFARAAGVVALVAPTGGGKSTLLAEFVGRGHPMVTDDILALSSADGSVVGHAGPPVMSLPGRRSSPFRRLAVIDDEQWVLVDRPRVRARPLVAVVFLERRHRTPSVEFLPVSVSPLLEASLDTGVDPSRRAARFGLLADLAAQASLIRLACPPDLPAAETADLLDRSLAPAGR